MRALDGYRHCVCLILLVVLFLPASPVASQERNQPTLHWAYASYFGSGWYKLNSEQSAFIAHFAPTWKSGHVASLDVAGRESRYRVRVPFTLGVARLGLDDVPGFFDLDNFVNASIGLGADIDIPLTERFSIRPNIELGYGTVIGESEDAFTYRGDIRARYRFDSSELGWAIIGMAGIVAFDADTAPDDRFTFALAGAEYSHSIGEPGSDDSQTLLYWHLAYTDFFNRIRTQTGPGDFAETGNYWQAGLAFGKKGRPIKIWFLEFDRLGLAYDISPSGDLRGVNLVFGSLYDP